MNFVQQAAGEKGEHCARDLEPTYATAMLAFPNIAEILGYISGSVTWQTPQFSCSQSDWKQEIIDAF